VFARSAPTLRSAIESMAEYLPVLHCPGADVETVSAEATAEFRWRPYGDIGTDEQSIAHGLLLFVKFIESFAGRDFRPAYVNAVTDLSRKEIEFMENRFRCKVNARSAATAIGFDRVYLDRPLATSNKVLRGIIGSYLAQIKARKKPSLIEEVEEFVALELASGKCSLERCADKLNIAVRTLHRHLTSENTSFSEIVERQRCEVAKKALTDTRRTLDDVASMLGYAEQSSFGRAFKRWTNVTPQQYREIACSS
jgi:AraC-like DNA-binding protein